MPDKFIRLEEELYERIQELAKVDHRSTKKQLEVMLWEAYTHWGEEDSTLSDVEDLDRRLRG